MLTRSAPFTHAGHNLPGLPGLSRSPRCGWVDAPAFADLAAFADFNRDRYAITTVPPADIAAATPAALCRKRACAFSDWFAFSAAGTARSYADAAGLYRSDIAANQPRFDWLNGRRQLALNSASTNMLLRSSEFSTAPWAASGAVAVTADAGSAPDGSTTADLISDTTTADVNGVTQNSPITSSGNAYTASCFLKAGSSSVASLRLTIGASVIIGEVVINLASGVAQWRSGVAGTAFSVMPHGNGWYRLAITCTDNASGNASINLIIRPAFNTSYDGSIGISATGSVLAWGAQIEQSGFATPYIPTAGVVVVRASESCRMAPSIEAVLQRSAASVVVRGGLAQSSSTGRIVGTVANSALIAGSASANQIASWDNANSRGLGATLGSGTKASFGTAYGFDATGQSLVGNHGTIAADSFGPDARTTAHLGRSAAGASADGWYDFVGIAPSRLADARLAELAVPA